MDLRLFRAKRRWSYLQVSVVMLLSRDVMYRRPTLYTKSRRITAEPHGTPKSAWHQPTGLSKR